MTQTIVAQTLPNAASGDNNYATQADGRTLRVDRSKCFASPCPGCSNCDALCEMEAVVDQARDYAEAAHAKNTRRAYSVGWNDFSAYCSANGFDALPASPQTVALYVTSLASRAKLATIRLYIVAIAQTHKERGLESPTAHEMVRRIVRAALLARTARHRRVKRP
jgi:hypothetical protein